MYMDDLVQRVKELKIATGRLVNADLQVRKWPNSEASRLYWNQAYEAWNQAHIAYLDEVFDLLQLDDR